jgi:hypothetical protein
VRELARNPRHRGGNELPHPAAVQPDRREDDQREAEPAARSVRRAGQPRVGFAGAGALGNAAAVAGLA